MYKTSYTFLLTVVQEDLDLTRKITKWLIRQRNDGGAFRSTQDTVIGLQALATYQEWVDNVVSMGLHSTLFVWRNTTIIFN